MWPMYWVDVIEKLPSNAGVMKEIDSKGNVVLQITGASNAKFGYALWRDSLYGPPSDIAQ